MDEETLRRVLLGVGVLAVVGSALAAWQAMSLVRGVSSPFFTSIMCMSVNGSYAFSQPTTSQFCTAHDRSLGKLESSWCSFYPDSKSEACRQLVDLLQDRWADCLAFRLSKQTDFAQGAPKVAEYCRVLQSG